MAPPVRHTRTGSQGKSVPRLNRRPPSVSWKTGKSRFRGVRSTCSNPKTNAQYCTAIRVSSFEKKRRGETSSLALSGYHLGGVRKKGPPFYGTYRISKDHNGAGDANGGFDVPNEGRRTIRRAQRRMDCRFRIKARGRVAHLGGLWTPRG